MRILIVDDDEMALDFLESTLKKSGYSVEKTTDPLRALELVCGGEFRLVISDWEMPSMSGLELCQKIRQRVLGRYVFIILVTAHNGVNSVVAGLDAGADDFLTKPFHPAELCVRLRSCIRMLSLDTRDVTIFALAKLASSRDTETGSHLERIREYCQVLAVALSKTEKYEKIIDGDYIEALYRTSPLHDIGKVGVPDRVLQKPGRLSKSEFEIMKRHTLLGAETLQAAIEQSSDTGFLRMARDIALTHHERYDGLGYPRGLAAEEIPLSGRIVALADAYDALTTKRVYKNAYTHEVADGILVADSGTHFDPDVVKAYKQCEAQFIAIQRHFSDEGLNGRPISGKPSYEFAGWSPGISLIS
jgi:putative two-component system response regulator